MSDDVEYEVYRERFRVTEWRNESVFRTVSEGHTWVPMSTIEANVPRQTNVTYASVSDGVAEQMATTIRRARKEMSR